MENTTKPKKKKNSKVILLVVILLLLLCGAGGFAYYLYSRPAEAVKSFLDHAKAMDLQGIASDLSTGDITPLDEAKITDPAYADFFRQANALITYDIKKTSYRFSNATVRAEIRYPDGSEIYKQSMSDFMKQVVSSAFSGTEATTEELMAQFSQSLNANASSLGQNLTSTTVDFYLVKDGGTWYIDALDDSMVQIMSANFRNTEKELADSLSQLSSDAQPAVPQAEDGSVIDLTADTFTIRYHSYKLGQDVNGNPCLLVYYDYTNNGSAPSSAMVDVSLIAYQNGQKLDVSVAGGDDPAIDQYMNDVAPGQTVNVCQAFSVIDTTSDVTVEVSEAYSFNDNSAAQLLKLQ